MYVSSCEVDAGTLLFVGEENQMEKIVILVQLLQSIFHSRIIIPIIVPKFICAKKSSW